MAITDLKVPRHSPLVLLIVQNYWLLVAVLTVQFVPHRKHTPSPEGTAIPVTGRGGL
jgi:hypothetical protein